MRWDSGIDYKLQKLGTYKDSYYVVCSSLYLSYLILSYLRHETDVNTVRQQAETLQHELQKEIQQKKLL